MIGRLALDTNAYRAYDDGNVSIRDAMRGAASLGLPVTVLGELYYGIYNGSKRPAALRQLTRFLASPRLEILYITADTARIYGEIATELRRSGRPVQQNDIWIAALCKQHGFVLATADTGFENIVGLETFSFQIAI